jgi:hypothetical protein
VPVDCYRGVTCLIRPGERDEEREETCNDGDGNGANFHICLFLLELIFAKAVGSSQKRGPRVQREILDLVSLAIRSIPLGVIGDAISKRQRLIPYDHPPL